MNSCLARTVAKYCVLTLVSVPGLVPLNMELTILLRGRRLAHNKGYRNPASFIGIALTIHQATAVYMHWVILGMELDYWPLGYNIY